MAAFLGILTESLLLVFAVSAMMSMGLSLTVKAIITPLTNARLVITATVVNFVLVPLVGYIILLIIPLDEDLRIGLILLATASGAPFLPKMAEFAKGNIAFSVGLMVLQVVITIIYMPIVLPYFLPAAEIDSWAIVKSLILIILAPLAIGLIIRARYETAAARMEPFFRTASNIALMALMALLLVINFKNMIGLVGTGGIAAVIILLVASLVIGYLLGGSDRSIKSVMGLGAATRNLLAALVVAEENFHDQEVVVFLLVAAVLGLVILVPIAGKLGRRVKAHA